MPASDLAHIVLVLDRSGSMASMRGAAVHGVNALLRKQCALPGRATATLVQFSERLHLSWANVPVGEACLFPEDYRTEGGTALLDAVGFTIDRTGDDLAALSEEMRPGKVLFAILTDGEENSSRRYDAAAVAERIRRQTDVYSWEFLFLGASASWLEQACELGIAQENAVNFAPEPEALQCVLMEASERISHSRRRR